MRARDGRNEGLLVMLVLLGAAAWALAAPGGPADFGLSAPAAKAIKAAFPAAVIKGVGLEGEDGAAFYIVLLAHKGKIREVEVARDGTIGEIETVLGLEEVPRDIADAIAKATGGGEILVVQTHERRGVPRAGRLVKLDVPVLFYTVEFHVNGAIREVEIPAGPAWRLPQRARDAIEEAFPHAAITKVEVEREMGLKLYEVELQQNGKRFEAEVSPEGIIVAVESAVTKAELPKAVADALANAAEGARILELQKEEIRAVPRLVKLDKPQVVYEAVFVRDGKRHEIEVAADGTVVQEQEDDEDQ